MKNFTLLFLLIAAVTITGCKKDEGEKNQDNIVGKWYTKQTIYTAYENNKIVEHETQTEFDDKDFFEFKSNGTAHSGSGDKYTYKISGNTLTLNDDGEEEIYQIKKLTSSDAVLYREETDGSFRSTEEITLKK